MAETYKAISNLAPWLKDIGLYFFQVYLKATLTSVLLLWLQNQNPQSSFREDQTKLTTLVQNETVGWIVIKFDFNLIWYYFGGPLTFI